MTKKQLFLQIYEAAQKKYGSHTKRLAAESWNKPWKTLISTILSARNRDEVTIPTCERFFAKFDTLEKISKAPLSEIKEYLHPINFFENKSKYVQETARILLEKFNGEVPDTIEELVTLPGVGRKTANLVLTVVHNKDGICVDTHVHRLSNVLGIVKTKTPHETEMALQKLAPKSYWSKINRLFVLWGKEVPGKDKKRLLDHLK